MFPESPHLMICKKVENAIFRHLGLGNGRGQGRKKN